MNRKDDEKKVTVKEIFELFPTLEFPPKKRKIPSTFRWFMFKWKKTTITIRWVIVSFVLVFTVSFLARGLYDEILESLDNYIHEIQDDSMFVSGVKYQVPKTVTLVYEDNNGKLVRVLADADEYSQFVKKNIQKLETARVRIKSNVMRYVSDGTDPIFNQMLKRKELFADWYFSWATGYRIIVKATGVYFDSSFSQSSKHTAQEETSREIEHYLQKQFSGIVMKPTITDEKLRQGYINALTQAHMDFLNVMTQIDNDFQKFVSNQTTHMKYPTEEPVSVQLDWPGQFSKLNIGAFEKGGIGAVAGLGIVGGGAITGMVGGTAVGKALSGALTKGLFSKLASPFVSKVLTIAAGALSGSLGGPVGAAVGGTLGVGVDVLVNEGVELVQRDQFEAEIQLTIEAIRDEWQRMMVLSVEGAIYVWISDTINLLPVFDS